MGGDCINSVRMFLTCNILLLIKTNKIIEILKCGKKFYGSCNNLIYCKSFHGYPLMFLSMYLFISVNLYVYIFMVVNSGDIVKNARKCSNKLELDTTQSFE